MHEPSWRDDIVVIVSLFLDVVPALNKELAQPVNAEAGSEGNAVRFAQCGMLCAQGAYFLGCTWLHVKADSLRWHDGQLVRHVRLDPGIELVLARRGAW